MFKPGDVVKCLKFIPFADGKDHLPGELLPVNVINHYYFNACKDDYLKMEHLYSTYEGRIIERM